MFPARIAEKMSPSIVSSALGGSGVQRRVAQRARSRARRSRTASCSRGAPSSRRRRPRRARTAPSAPTTSPRRRPAAPRAARPARSDAAGARARRATRLLSPSTSSSSSTSASRQTRNRLALSTTIPGKSFSAFAAITWSRLTKTRAGDSTPAWTRTHCRSSRGTFTRTSTDSAVHGIEQPESPGGREVRDVRERVGRHRGRAASAPARSRCRSAAETSSRCSSLSSFQPRR